MSATRVVVDTSLRAALRHRGLWLALGWAALGIAVAAARRGEGADDVVIGALGTLVIPLVAFALAGAVLAGRSYRASVEPLVRLGAPKVPATLAPFAVAGATSAIACALLGAITVALARAPGAPIRDVITTAWIAAVGGAGYAAVFVGASSFGRSGGGRAVALVLDLVIGAGGGLGGALTVRGHLRNLLGGSAPIDIGQRASFVVVIALALAAVAIAWHRSRPRARPF